MFILKVLIGIILSSLLGGVLWGIFKLAEIIKDGVTNFIEDKFKDKTYIKICNISACIFYGSMFLLFFLSLGIVFYCIGDILV